MSNCPGCGLAVGPEATLAPGGLMHCEVCGRVFALTPEAPEDSDSITSTVPWLKRSPALHPGEVVPSLAAPSGLLGLKLSVVRGPASGRVIDIEGQEIVVGRSKGDVVIADPEMSRQHLSFQLVGGRCLVRDLASTNGILIDGVRVAQATVVPGQEVTLGHTVLRLVEIRDAGSKR